MKKTEIAITVGLLLILALACSNSSGGGTNGSGKIVRESRNISGFTGVDLQLIGDVYIIQGETESVEVESDDNVLPLLETKVVDKALTLGKVGDTFLSPTKVNYYITVKDLNNIVISGAGRFIVEKIETDEMSILINGAGNVNFTELIAENISVTVEGGGQFKADKIDSSTFTLNIDGAGRGEVLGGSVETLTIIMPRSGVFFGEKFESAIASVDIKGAGTAKVWATDRLDIKIDGSGAVFYKGSPQINTSINGAGSVREIK